MQTTDYEKQAQDLLDKHGIKFRATLSDSKPAPWRNDRRDHRLTSSADPRHYRVTLSKSWHEETQTQLGEDGYMKVGRVTIPGARITFDFWSSISDAEKGIVTVTPYDVLACISGDVHCPETFKEWCSEYGYEEDSIKALQAFRRGSAFARRLRAFFAEEEIEALQEIH